MHAEAVLLGPEGSRLQRSMWNLFFIVNLDFIVECVIVVAVLKACDVVVELEGLLVHGRESQFQPLL